MIDAPEPDDSRSDFLRGGGVMGELMRLHDWSRTPLGSPAGWPPELRTLVGVILGSGQPMFITWGAERTMLYNDAYAPICGGKHPGALGRPFVEVWADILSFVGPVMDRAYEGQSTHVENMAIAMVDRRGYPEQTHFAFSYTPIRGAEGGVAGAFCACIEITETVFATRRLRFLFELNDALRGISDPRELLVTAASHIGPHLGVGRVAYGELLEDGETLAIDCEWSSDASNPAAERLFPLRALGPEVLAELRAGRIVRIDDARTSPVSAVTEALFARRGIRAALAVPLFDGGRWVAVVFAQQQDARRWREDEATLLRDVGERTWEAVGRARSVAALREGEARLRMLDALGQASRSARDAHEIMSSNTRLLGEHLAVTRCAYADVEADGDEFTLKDWTDGAPSSAGRYRLNDFGPRAAEDMRLGRTLVICDVDAELAPEAGGSTFSAIGIKAIVCCPLVKGGRLMAMMAVHSARPRVWTSAEVALTQEVVERSWAHIERARSEEKLREQDARKDEFLAILAHELRNPLAPLRTGLAVLAADDAGERRSPKVLDMMGRQLGHMVGSPGTELEFAL